MALLDHLVRTTLARRGETCRICKRGFEAGESIKVAEGYKLVCADADTCIRAWRHAKRIFTDMLRPQNAA